MKLPIISEIKVSYLNKVPAHQRLTITSSADAASILKRYWNPDTIELLEEFKILMLNRANKLIGIHDLSKGSTTGTIVDGKILFAVALKANAHRIILAHNHPSGNLNPSAQDVETTSKYSAAAKLLDMEIIDHVILTKESYYSFADEGMLR